MQDDSKNGIMKLMDFLKSLDLPSWLVKNVVTALGKGVYNVTFELTEIPVNHLKNHNEKIKLKGNIKRDLIKKASIEYSEIFDNNPEFAERALTNYGIKILEEQQNKEIIALKTLKYLDVNKSKAIESTGGEIGYDWLTSFWKLAETKTDDDIREILARILSQEIIKPNSLSLHTLQVLSILSSNIGQIFNKLCNLSIDDGEMAYFIHPNVFTFQRIGTIDEYGLSLNDLLKLDGAGLIRSTEAIKLNFGENRPEKIDFAGLKAEINFSGLQIDLIYFTQAGRELRNLMDLKPDFKYIDAIKNKLKDKIQIE
ncbi:MAG: DUF2806 domain-containing protein [Bacteroidales bacterium]|nr:DUF2806 domain-containing protein [Bacteroidales bacterium]